MSDDYFFPPQAEGLLPPQDTSFFPPQAEGFCPPHDDALLPQSAKSLSAIDELPPVRNVEAIISIPANYRKNALICYRMYNCIMIHKHELPECPAATAIELIGSKWKLLIIRRLLQSPCRFNELKRNLEGISHKVLAESLRSMEYDGLITRKVYDTSPPMVEYSLSELGLTLKPLLHEMENWGNFYKYSVN